MIEIGKLSKGFNWPSIQRVERITGSGRYGDYLNMVTIYFFKYMINIRW